MLAYSPFIWSNCPPVSSVIWFDGPSARLSVRKFYSLFVCPFVTLHVRLFVCLSFCCSFIRQFFCHLTNLLFVVLQLFCLSFGISSVNLPVPSECPSVRLSLRTSVRLSFRSSLHPSVRRSVSLILSVELFSHQFVWMLSFLIRPFFDLPVCPSLSRAEGKARADGAC